MKTLARDAGVVAAWAVSGFATGLLIGLIWRIVA